MKTILASALAVVAIGCGSAAGESTQTNSTDLEAGRTETTTAFQCMTFGRFNVTGDTVIDSTDGKVWQRDVVPQKRTQPEAVAYCASLELGARHNWRLPEAEELVNIRLRPGLIKGGPGFCSPSIDQVAFPATPADMFWTNTTRPEEQGVYTDFADGRSHYSDPAEPLYVRCIHDEDVTTIGRRVTPALPQLPPQE